MDVPLEVTVELGRTKKSISEILDFAPGTIIELDRIAGEPIDVLVNGKFVAKGEVVVIEEGTVKITAHADTVTFLTQTAYVITLVMKFLHEGRVTVAQYSYDCSIYQQISSFRF